MIALYKALLKAQTQISHAVKDARNPHFRNNYATLESVIDAVKKPLNDNGIFILHFTSQDHVMTTTLVHAESGESISSCKKLLLSNENMQQLGSAETYCKRYNLTALLNLPTEDDDGNEAAQVKPQQQQTNDRPDLLDGTFHTGCNEQLKGKKYSEVKREALINFVGYWENKAKENGQVLNGQLASQVESVKKYLQKS